MFGFHDSAREAPRRILSEWVTHYNQGRPHLSLEPGIPERAAVFPPLQDHDNIPFPKTARSWLAWFSAASITSTGGKESPREGQEEFRKRCALIASPQFLLAVRAGLVPFVCSETNESGEELVGSYLYQVHLHYDSNSTSPTAPVRQRCIYKG